MKNIDNLFIFLLVFLSFTANAFAYDEVILIPTERRTLSTPKTYFENIEKNEDENISRIKKDEKSAYFDTEEEMFDNKAGRIFSKFVNDKVINNKLNRMYSEVETRFLDNEY